MSEKATVWSDQTIFGASIPGARQFGEKKRNFNGESLWARGYAVSTVGFELEEVRKYIRHQEKLDNKDDEKTFKTFDLGSL